MSSAQSIVNSFHLFLNYWSYGRVASGKLAPVSVNVAIRVAGSGSHGDSDGHDDRVIRFDIS